jgi:hypothetical protein
MENTPGQKDNNRNLIDILMVAVGILIVLVAGISVAAWRASDRATRAAEEIEKVEREDRDVARMTAFRLCSRNTADRAFSHARIRGIPVPGAEDSRGITPEEIKSRRALSRELMKPVYIPILDCSPNLRGMGAKTQSIAEQENYLKRWAAGKLTGPERGVCPGQKFGTQSC